MKPEIWAVMQNIIGDATPSFVGEIGTHKAGTAKQIIRTLAPRVDTFTYWGYDIFDQTGHDLQFHRSERNGKGPAQLEEVERILETYKGNYPNIEYKLHVGLTTDTLIEPVAFDFVYIDGGHSYETVMHDYSMVKDSKLIVFDDYKQQGVKDAVADIDANFEIIDTVVSKHIWAVIRN